MKKATTIIVAAMLFITAFAQYPKVEVSGTEVRRITSTNVAGQEYVLNIMVPGGYRNSNKKYPVLYVMDAQWDFPLSCSLYGQQYFDGFIPEMIIVGVTWGGVNPNPDSLRARDYTPTNEARLPQSGGADNFLAFMKNELFPFIEANYRVDANDRGLMGCSLGGLFTMYSLFTHSDMFQRYIAASPAYGWGNQVLYQYEKNYFENTARPKASLFMCIGGVERSVPGFEKLTQFLMDRHYPNLQLQSRVLENTGHSGTKGEGFARGMQFVFKKPQLKLDDVALNRLTGNYHLANGNNIEVKNENNQLVISFSQNNKYQLYAASENEFYAKTEFFKVYFENKDDKITGFRLDRYGNSQFVSKQ